MEKSFKSGNNAYNKYLGDIGENISANYLTNNGYQILEKNYRFSKLGEIDIIARDNEYICFVEVKTRIGNKYGVPSEAVNKNKREKIKRLANFYLINKGFLNENVRFDVIEILIDHNNTINSENIAEHYKIKDINLIKNAFY